MISFARLFDRNNLCPCSRCGHLVLYPCTPGRWEFKYTFTNHWESVTIKYPTEKEMDKWRLEDTTSLICISDTDKEPMWWPNNAQWRKIHYPILWEELKKGLKEQLPLKRFLRNFFITRNAWGLFSIYSHLNKSGTLKVKYNTLVSAQNAAEKMKLKNGYHYSAYKCIRCSGYHLGRNKSSIKAKSEL